MIDFISFIAGLFAGVLAWTFAEYILHRFWGHQSDPRKWYNIFTRLHTKHHAVKGFYADFKQKATLLFSVTAISSPLVFFLSNPFIAWGLSTGLLMMAAFYEYIHYTIHEREPRNRYELWARKHHLSHHFTNPQTNHGVTTDLWDRIFGTYQKVDCVKIPKSLCNDWLMDEQHRTISRKWAQHFSIKGAVQKDMRN